MVIVELINATKFPFEEAQSMWTGYCEDSWWEAISSQSRRLPGFSASEPTVLRNCPMFKNTFRKG